MTEIRLAYRHDNGEVEGFKGFAFSGEAKARENAIGKIIRKLAELSSLESDRPARVFDKNRLIERKDGLTAEEIRSIQHDWTLNR